MMDSSDCCSLFSVDSNAECDPDTSTSGSYSDAVKWNKDMSQYQKQDETVALKIAIEQSMPKRARQSSDDSLKLKISHLDASKAKQIVQNISPNPKSPARKKQKVFESWENEEYQPGKPQIPLGSFPYKMSNPVNLCKEVIDLTISPVKPKSKPRRKAKHSRRNSKASTDSDVNDGQSEDEFLVLSSSSSLRDKASMDENGYVKIIGRVKDMIIRGGENIYPSEIEQFLHHHPKIQEVEVIGVPDKRLGEEVCAWIRLMKGETATTDEIKEFCKGKIAHFKIPRYIKFVDDMPMTVTGKVQKYLIREISAKELGLE